MKYRGFSIIEVMFAIMILGIGFIMVAAMFPVAIQQSQANIDESTARSVASAGAVQTANVLRLLDQPAVNTNGEFRRIAELTNASPVYARDLINSSVVYQADTRFGWSSFYQYQYDATNPSRKTYSLITVALRARTISDQDTFENWLGYSGYPDASWQTGADGYDNAAIRCRVDFYSEPGTPGFVEIDNGGPNPDQANEAAVEGAIIIIRTHSDPSVAGRVYYLSEWDSYSNRWSLDPKSDALPTTGSGLSNVEAYLVGRGLQFPNKKEWGSNNRREGASQVVGVYRMTSALP